MGTLGHRDRHLTPVAATATVRAPLARAGLDRRRRCGRRDRYRLTTPLAETSDADERYWRERQPALSTDEVMAFATTDLLYCEGAACGARCRSQERTVPQPRLPPVLRQPVLRTKQQR